MLMLLPVLMLGAVPAGSAPTDAQAPIILAQAPAAPETEEQRKKRIEEERKRRGAPPPQQAPRPPQQPSVQQPPRPQPPAAQPAPRIEQRPAQQPAPPPARREVQEPPRAQRGHDLHQDRHRRRADPEKREHAYSVGSALKEIQELERRRRRFVWLTCQQRLGERPLVEQDDALGRHEPVEHAPLVQVAHHPLWRNQRGVGRHMLVREIGKAHARCRAGRPREPW